MGLLETRPNEAKRLDEVRGRWVPTPLILAASCFPSHRLLYSLCQRRMHMHMLTCYMLHVRSYVDHMHPTAASALRSVVTCRCTTP
jgi:hypothetical protein